MYVYIIVKRKNKTTFLITFNFTFFLHYPLVKSYADLICVP